jgi:hypothetical protein
VATPNYGYEKRQKELAKKRKKEEKLKTRAERGHTDSDDASSPDSELNTEPTTDKSSTE